MTIEFESMATAMIQKRNNMGLSDFDGLSPAQMHMLMYSLFDDESAITFNQLTNQEYTEVPLFNVFKVLAQTIDAQDGIKLTATGNLPPKIVKEIYAQGLLLEPYLEKGLIKLRTEPDSLSIRLSRILLDLAGLTKIRKKKLSLTKKGQKLITGGNSPLFTALLATFCNKFNWSFFDGFGADTVGRTGFEYTLYLLSKYGNEQRDTSFYSEKHLIAFPDLIRMFEYQTYSTPAGIFHSCYSVRTFERCLKLLGLVDIEFQGLRQDRIELVSITPLFTKLIHIKF